MAGAAVREISYAHGVQTAAGQAVVRAVENLTGRIGLIRRARGYEVEVAAGADFWEVIARRYGLTLDLPDPGLARIPAEGPLVLVANHPYGILDGLMMGRALSARRQDFRIIAHQVFRKADEIDRFILPISFDGTREAQKLNIETRREAMEHLARGGAIGIFPGGTVSTAREPFGRAMDPAWRTFTAKMVARSEAAVVPMFFEGANSRAFQLASHLHATLRLALLIAEFRRRIGDPVRAVIGDPLPAEQIDARRRDPRALMDYLRASTYALSPQPLDDIGYGYEFEETWS
ncbi:Putative hemolysin [Albimonas donghaensis]|uniref:Putative hemolysin n=1 Tax=Albimonas donghaensis TaxID=356660 RepID=A0A1H2QQT5_9RHOB|nr:lysophospholipid acyltransferase family protein [Albimonas donghaensis]SDW09522.1 Putative hemolysin [Albimonas donghaensis]